MATKARAIIATDVGVNFFQCDNCSLDACVIGVKDREGAITLLVTKYHWMLDEDGYLRCPGCTKEIVEHE